MWGIEKCDTNTLWSLSVDVHKRALVDAVCETCGKGRGQIRVGKIGGTFDFIIATAVRREV